MKYNLIDIEEINAAAAADGKTLVQGADAAYYQSVRELAKDIHRHREERPIILLSGPSGSGKTTTALLLERYLDDDGCETQGEEASTKSVTFETPLALTQPLTVDR